MGDWERAIIWAWVAAMAALGRDGAAKASRIGGRDLRTFFPAPEWRVDSEASRFLSQRSGPHQTTSNKLSQKGQGRTREEARGCSSQRLSGFLILSSLFQTDTVFSCLSAGIIQPRRRAMAHLAPVCSVFVWSADSPRLTVITVDSTRDPQKDQMASLSPRGA